MKKRAIFAVCDLEVSYAYNFMEYVNQKKNMPFEVQAFTSPVHLCAFARTQPIELLLISDKAMCPEIKGLPIRQIIILSEGVHDPGLDQYPSVYKYQSSASVIREVMACYGEEVSQPAEVTVLKKETRLLAVYSPVGRCQKTSFALALGQILARQKAVLYLNLEEYAGGEHYFSKEQEQNLGDLLYYSKQETGNLGLRISMMTGQIGNMDYIRPIPVVQDLQAVTAEEWLQLFEQIVEKSIYEVLILDLGDSVNGLFSILEKCDSVHTLSIEEPAAKAKLQQYTENLLRTGHEKILEHTVQKVVRSRNGGTVI